MLIPPGSLSRSTAFRIWLTTSLVVLHPGPQVVESRQEEPGSQVGILLVKNPLGSLGRFLDIAGIIPELL